MSWDPVCSKSRILILQKISGLNSLYKNLTTIKPKISTQLQSEWVSLRQTMNLLGLVGWFLCLMGYQLFLGYLIPKPFS